MLGKLFKKWPSGVRVSLLSAVAVLAFVGALGFSWLPIAPPDSVAAAPCKLGEQPEYDSNNKLKEDSCTPPSLEDCDPTLERCSGETVCTGDDCGLIDKYLHPTINFLAMIVGLVITISLVVAGIQYSSAGDNPQATAKAKNRIVESLLALLAFALLYLGIQWLIPGGFF